MILFYCLVLIVQCGFALFPGAEPDEGDVRHLYPILYIGIGLDEHAHALPYLLGWLENIEYPKHQIRIEMFMESREDATFHQVKWWLGNIHSLYKSVKLVGDAENWMETALRNGRLNKAARCILMRGDSIPTDYHMISRLFNEKKHIIVTPVMESIDGSVNIEGGISENLRQRKIVREEMGGFSLPLAIALNTIDSSYLTFDKDNLSFYDGPDDPATVFVESAAKMNIEMWADNQVNYGIYVNPALDVGDRRRTIRYHLADIIADYGHVPIVSKSVRPWTPDGETFGMDKIYLINLERRQNRLSRMQKIFSLLGIEYTRIDAVDGQRLDKLDNDLAQYRVLDGYLDPISKRPIKKGEIGCFLSHYKIWKQVVDEGYERVIVFEDDLRFSHDGMQRVVEVLQDLDGSGKPWDLIYLGRKKQSNEHEVWIDQHRHLSSVEYSYWTIGYMLSQSGAKKLLTPDPLMNIIPVDEYLPIMYNKHPNKEWMNRYEPRDLNAFTLYPLVVFPQRYTNEPGYVSDTEDSVLIATSTERNLPSIEKDEL